MKHTIETLKTLREAMSNMIPGWYYVEFKDVKIDFLDRIDYYIRKEEESQYHCNRCGAELVQPSRYHLDGVSYCGDCWVSKRNYERASTNIKFELGIWQPPTEGFGLDPMGVAPILQHPAEKETEWTWDANNRWYYGLVEDADYGVYWGVKKPSTPLGADW